MDIGKAWEQRFKTGWEKSFPGSICYRLHDYTNGQKTVSQNPCDFICYINPNIYFIECKSHLKASIPFDEIPQHERLEKFVGIPGVRAGVILWLREKDKVYYIPAKTITQMKADGKKSVGIKAVEEGYRIIELPAEKLRTFMEVDYTGLPDLLQDGD